LRRSPQAGKFAGTVAVLCFSREKYSRKRDRGVNFISASVVLNVTGEHPNPCPSEGGGRRADCTGGRLMRHARQTTEGNKIMNRILIAAAAVLSLAGVASAQQVPTLEGNYSSNVLDAFNGTVTPADSSIRLDSAASARNTADVPSGSVQTTSQPDFEVYSGK